MLRKISTEKLQKQRERIFSQEGDQKEDREKSPKEQQPLTRSISKSVHLDIHTLHSMV